jgi:cytochrome c oxidase subunit 2
MDVRQLPPEEYGALLFKARGCVTCHGPGRRSPIGADLAGLYGSTVQLEGGATATADEAYLREAILEPNAKVVAGFKPLMPAFRGQLDDQQIDALIAYIKTLKKP